MIFSKLNNEYFNSFIEEGLDKDLVLWKDQNISNSIANKLKDCLNNKEFSDKKIKKSDKKIERNLTPIEIIIKTWQEILNKLEKIQYEIQKTITEFIIYFHTFLALR